MLGSMARFEATAAAEAGTTVVTLAGECDLAVRDDGTILAGGSLKIGVPRWSTGRPHGEASAGAIRRERRLAAPLRKTPDR